MYIKLAIKKKICSFLRRFVSVFYLFFLLQLSPCFAQRVHNLALLHNCVDALYTQIILMGIHKYGLVKKWAVVSSWLSL